jgi:hypothetical protein
VTLSPSCGREDIERCEENEGGVSAHLLVEPQTDRVPVRLHKLLRRRRIRLAALLGLLRLHNSLETRLHRCEVHAKLLILHFLLLNPLDIVRELLNLAPASLSGRKVGRGGGRGREVGGESLEEVGGPGGGNFLQGTGGEGSGGRGKFGEVVGEEVRLTGADDDLSSVEGRKVSISEAGRKEENSPCRQHR